MLKTRLKRCVSFSRFPLRVLTVLFGPFKVKIYQTGRSSSLPGLSLVVFEKKDDQQKDLAAKALGFQQDLKDPRLGRFCEGCQAIFQFVLRGDQDARINGLLFHQAQRGCEWATA